jgi:hypothetical protein
VQQRIQNRLVDFGRPIGRRERRDVFPGAGLHLSSNARRMQAERGVEAGTGEIELARDQQRATQLRHRLVGQKLRALVEPFWHQKLGACAGCRTPALDFDLGAYKDLRRGRDPDSAEPERAGKGDRSFKECDIAHGQT